MEEIESVRSFNYEQFNESASIPGLLEIEDEKEEIKKANKDSSTFSWLGILSMLFGAGVLLGENIPALGLKEFVPFFGIAGLVTLGIGFFKGIGRLFSKKRLNLPPLQIKKKTKRYAQPQVTSVKATQTTKRGGLYKSVRDKVIFGVCGGLAEQSGIPATLIRLFFVAAFAISGGSAAVIYILLALFLRNQFNSK